MADDRGLALWRGWRCGEKKKKELIHGHKSRRDTKVTVAERLPLLEVRLYKEVRKFPNENS